MGGVTGQDHAAPAPFSDPAASEAIPGLPDQLGVVAADPPRFEEPPGVLRGVDVVLVVVGMIMNSQRRRPGPAGTRVVDRAGPRRWHAKGSQVGGVCGTTSTTSQSRSKPRSVISSPSRERTVLLAPSQPTAYAARRMSRTRGGGYRTNHTAT